jgi:hypothetical protein
MRKPTEHHKKNIRLWLGITLAVSMTAGDKSLAYPLPLIQNLSEATSAIGPIDYQYWQASNFTTGNEPNPSLDSATLWLREVTASNNFFVALYSNDGIFGSPTTLLTNFTRPTSFSSVPAANIFSLPGPLALTANTTYWLVAGVSNDDGGLYEWSYTNSFKQSGFADWSIGNGFAFKMNGSGNGWGGDPDGGPYMFSINQTVAGPPPPPPAAPAPTPLPLLGAGAFWARSRKLRSRLKRSSNPRVAPPST